MINYNRLGYEIKRDLANVCVKCSLALFLFSVIP